MRDAEMSRDTRWFALGVGEVVEMMATDAERGLSSDEAAHRLEQYGRNELAADPLPSRFEVVMHQVVDPMNLMLAAVAVISIVIGEVSTGVLVAGLVILNVVLGARQEMKAKEAVDALARLQIPVSKVIRDGSTIEVAASEVVPGDLVAVEAGDIVPADGRIARSATLESQEAGVAPVW